MGKWTDPSDEDKDDELLNRMGKDHRNMKPHNRGCALVLIVGAGGVAALGFAVDALARVMS